MINKKQENLYKKILLEILDANIDLRYNGFILKSLKHLEGGVRDKINAYHLFFKTFSSVSSKLSEWTNKEFNIHIDSIRQILADNKYTLSIDEIEFENLILEQKRRIDLQYYLK